MRCGIIKWLVNTLQCPSPHPPPQVDNRPHLSPDFMECVMDLLAQAEAVYAARGTEEYPAMLALLPEAYRDQYHKILQKGAQYVVTLFLAQRAVESIKVLDFTDLVKEEDDTLEFSYWREVSSWPHGMVQGGLFQWPRHNILL